MIPISSPASRGTTVRIFLADGTPDGLRVVEKSNWTGIALMCSRVQYARVSIRPEFDRPCVYVLTGPSEEIIDRQQVYIGQSDIGRSRIDSHARQKDFWTHLILFTSKDSNLNRAHVQYLESRLIQLGRQAKRADLTNGNIPNPPSLSEADVADMESFLEDMLTIYPLLGVNAFSAIDRPDDSPETETPLLYLSGPDTAATGRLTTQGFIVYKGATGRFEAVDSFPDFRRSLRKKLHEDGVLLPVDGRLVLNQDYLFNSSTEAASILLGRPATGPTDWKDRQRNTLRSLQEAEFSPVAGESLDN